MKKQVAAPSVWMFEDLPPDAPKAVVEVEQPKPKRGAKSELDLDAETLRRWISEEEGLFKMMFEMGDKYPDRRAFWMARAKSAALRQIAYEDYYHRGDFSIVRHTRQKFLDRVSALPKPEPVLKKITAMVPVMRVAEVFF